MTILKGRLEAALIRIILREMSSMKRTRSSMKTKRMKDDDIGGRPDSCKQIDKIGDTVVCKKSENAVSIVGSETSVNQNEAVDTTSYSRLSPQTNESEKQGSNSKVNLKILKTRRTSKKLQQNSLVQKGKLRPVVDLDKLSDELKQLEDPPQTQLEKELCSARLQYSFYNTSCEVLAQNLLGTVLVRYLEDGTILKGRIVETEAYLGTIDKASHTYQNRVTPRNIPMYMPPGTIYVYMTYGMYHCFNISSEGNGCAVLIRALDPIEGISYMTNHRSGQIPQKAAAKRQLKKFKTHELCNGPSKLCMAYQLDKNHSKYSMCTWKGLWLEKDCSLDTKITIVQTKRIGIDSCGSEWADKSLRYYIYGNKSVSKRDKRAEALLEDQ